MRSLETRNDDFLSGRLGGELLIKLDCSIN